MNALLVALGLLVGQEYRRPMPCDVQANAALALAKAQRERNAQPVTPAPAYQSPPGFHRHRFSDGTIIEHRDNTNEPGAHTHNGETVLEKYNGPLPPSASQAKVKTIVGYRYEKVCDGLGCRMVKIPVYSN